MAWRSVLEPLLGTRGRACKKQARRRLFCLGHKVLCFPGGGGKTSRRIWYMDETPFESGVGPTTESWRPSVEFDLPEEGA